MASLVPETQGTVGTRRLPCVLPDRIVNGHTGEWQRSLILHSTTPQSLIIKNQSNNLDCSLNLIQEAN